jgi:transketolase
MNGQALGMKTFGASAPLKELQKKFGFTVQGVVESARQQLRRESTSRGQSGVESVP